MVKIMLVSMLVIIWVMVVIGIHIWGDNNQIIKNRLLNDYPCSDYLHNALRFLREGNVDAAYDEICHAIIRSGGKLTEEEQEFRKPKFIRGQRAKVIDWSDTKEIDISILKSFLETDKVD